MPELNINPNDHFTILAYLLVTVLVVLIPAAVALITLFYRGKQTARDVAEVKVQVKNNHSTNLREEADERHHENGTKIDTVLKRLDELAENDRNLFKLIVGLTGRTDEIDERTGGHPKRG